MGMDQYIYCNNPNTVSHGFQMNYWRKHYPLNEVMVKVSGQDSAEVYHDSVFDMEITKDNIEKIIQELNRYCIDDATIMFFEYLWRHMDNAIEVEAVNGDWNNLVEIQPNKYYYSANW